MRVGAVEVTAKFAGVFVGGGVAGDGVSQFGADVFEPKGFVGVAQAAFAEFDVGFEQKDAAAEAGATAGDFAHSVFDKAGESAAVEFIDDEGAGLCGDVGAAEHEAKVERGGEDGVFHPAALFVEGADRGADGEFRVPEVVLKVAGEGFGFLAVDGVAIVEDDEVNVRAGAHLAPSVAALREHGDA